jgi:peptidyl-prolyl cis-trans isomerase SurA
MQSQITKNVKVTPGEVQEFFTSVPADSLPYYNAEVEVGQIVLYAKPSEKAKQEAMDDLKKIRQEIIDGDDFKLKAILYSDDPGSAKQGGELPEFTRDDPFAPEFIREAFRLEPGQISEPFETEFGFHILQVMDRKGERVKVRHILIQPSIKAADLDRTEEKADSIRKLLMHKKVTFGQAVGRFSEDENTKQYAGFLTHPNTGESLMEIDQLGAMDRQIPFVIDTMEAGDYSSPQYYQDQRKNQGYRILYLKRVTKPHKANLDQDYARIQTAALSQKKQRVIRQWVDERIKKTFIRIDDSYANCENLKPWRTANP